MPISYWRGGYTIPTDEEIAKELLNIVVRSRLRNSCVKCHNFDESNELCRLANIRPPAWVIVTGCEKFEEAIPF